MVGRKERGRFSKLFRRMSMQCLCSGDQMNGMDEMVQTSEKTIIMDGLASRYSSPKFVGEQHVNKAGTEADELSLQGGGSLNSKGTKADRGLEVKTWYDLALLYLRMLQWKDAELCISKIRAFSPYSPLACHATGKIHEAKGYLKEALQAYSKALDLEPKHVPSLISTATVLRQLGERPVPAVRCFLTDALRLDRTNHVAWFNLGLLYEDEGDSSALEAAECFRVAALLEETAPAEPFR